MAIGNAPWPIGVTMVGIHARTGREKIFAQNVARILFVPGLTFTFSKIIWTMKWWLKIASPCYEVKTKQTQCLLQHPNNKNSNSNYNNITAYLTMLCAWSCFNCIKHLMIINVFFNFHVRCSQWWNTKKIYSGITLVISAVANNLTQLGIMKNCQFRSSVLILK